MVPFLQRACPSRHESPATIFNVVNTTNVVCGRYFRCDALKALFVHAGFVAGVGLRQQNPRMMMNLRSIASDGTATSKVLEARPWARYVSILSTRRAVDEMKTTKTTKRPRGKMRLGGKITRVVLS